MGSNDEKLKRSVRGTFHHQRSFTIGAFTFDNGIKFKKRPLISKKWLNKILERNGIINGKYSKSRLRKYISNLKLNEKHLNRLKNIVSSIFPNNIKFLSLRKQSKSVDKIIDEVTDALQFPPSPEFDLLSSLNSASIESDGITDIENCCICLCDKFFDLFFPYRVCEHQICISCAVNYIYTKINSDGCTKIKCHQCDEILDLADIKEIIFFKLYYNSSMLEDIGELALIPSYDAVSLYEKLENMVLYRTLVTIPNIRFCPAPDCSYALIAKGYEKCPKLICGNSNCGISFCFHCKSRWHPGTNCMEHHLMSILEHMNNWKDKDVSEMYDMHREIITLFKHKKDFFSSSKVDECEMLESLLTKNTVKLCPKCSNAVVKSDDGSCNKMHCIICDTSFCWLCLKQVGESHFLTSSGCTYYGRKVWSKKKKLLWRLAIVLGGPLWIALGATFMLPFTMMAFPALSSLHGNIALKPKLGKISRKITVVSIFTFAFIMSPVLYLLILLAGLPMATIYIYVITSSKLGKLSKKWNQKTSFIYNDKTIEKSDLLEFISHSRVLLKKLEDKFDLKQLDLSKVEKLLKESFEKELEYLKKSDNDIPAQNNDLSVNEELYDIFSVLSEVISEDIVE